MDPNFGRHLMGGLITVAVIIAVFGFGLGALIGWAFL